MPETPFERLIELMSRLRGPDGCPWDREQTADSLKPMLIEEVYEVIDAIDARDPVALAEELGDLLLHVVFQAQLGRESGSFDIDAVINGICDKLIRRHPHVFGDETASDSAEVLRNWEVIKSREKAGRSDSAEPVSILAGVSRTQPALHEAHQISRKVAQVGFDWQSVGEVLGKLDEEIHELRVELKSSDAARRTDRIEDELGDIYFVLINIARHLGVDSESALKRSNRKFRQRFEHLEEAVRAEGRQLNTVPLEEMERLWQQAKLAGK